MHCCTIKAHLTSRWLSSCEGLIACLRGFVNLAARRWLLLCTQCAEIPQAQSPCWLMEADALAQLGPAKRRYRPSPKQLCPLCDCMLVLAQPACRHKFLSEQHVFVACLQASVSGTPARQGSQRRQQQRSPLAQQGRGFETPESGRQTARSVQAAGAGPSRGGSARRTERDGPLLTGPAAASPARDRMLHRWAFWLQ